MIFRCTLSSYQMFMIAWLEKAERSKRMIAAQTNTSDCVLRVIFLDGEIVSVPFSLFAPSPQCEPDFGLPHIVDYGSVIRFGEYEACVDSILPYKGKT